MRFTYLKQQWQKSFESSVSSVENCLIALPTDYPELTNFKKLCSWLIDTEHSAYDFMPNGYQSYRSNSYFTDNAFSLIKHALIDDGDICFVKMIHKQEVIRVFMMFVSHHENYFKQFCLMENQQLIKNKIAANERMNRVILAMKQKYPDNLQLSENSSITEDDFSFVAHCNPAQFITEVESLAKQKKLKRENFSKIRDQYMNSM